MQETGHERSLELAFHDVAEEDAGIGASPAVEARLLAEVRSIAAARRRRSSLALLAIAAALLLAVAVPVRRMLTRPPIDA
ncbi:MAG TPA: hypothetical protein VGX46_09875, partial [Vicinamibacterales bacterium]|nr:hypothetical protein [Vicinamibacterales bacterium]